MPRSYHRLSADDRQWALDHSTRAYHVRRTVRSDRAGLRGVAGLITIIRLFDGERLVAAEMCRLSTIPFEDTDDYGGFRFDAVNDARAVRGEARL